MKLYWRGDTTVVVVVVINVALLTKQLLFFFFHSCMAQDKSVLIISQSDTFIPESVAL